MISTREAAESLGISTRRVVALITSGRLPATRFGSQYVIDKKDLAKVRNRKPGRPKADK